MPEERVNPIHVINDTNVVPREERIKHTPVFGVQWKTVFGTEGQRGSTYCYPDDIPENRETIALLKEKGKTCLRYSSNGEPDFSAFKLAEVKISEMSANRYGADGNFNQAYEKLLNSSWAKDNGLKTKQDVKNYISDNNLTLHEKSDGVTVQLVPRPLHETFRHVGGVSENSHLEDGEDGLRQIGHAIGVTKVEIAKKGVATIDTINKNIDEATEKFISEDFSKINRAGIDAATEAAIFAGTLSIVRNTAKVVRGEKEKDEAIKDTVVDAASAAALGYATGALTKKFSDSVSGSSAALLTTATMEMSKLAVAYVNGDIDEQRFAKSAAETSAYLVAATIGKNVGGFIGAGFGNILGTMILPVVGGEIGSALGSEIGKIIGEYVTTAVCMELIETIKFSKAFKEKNHKIISLYRNAEMEIRASQSRLEELLNAENRELQQAISDGFSKIYAGIKEDSYSTAKDGLIIIGVKFGMTKEELDAGKVSRDNLFQMEETLVVR